MQFYPQINEPKKYQVSLTEAIQGLTNPLSLTIKDEEKY